MTGEEVYFFLNHKFNELGYMLESNGWLMIFTKNSKWKIKLDDYQRFHRYTLYHENQNQSFHVQIKDTDLSYLIYVAMTHDYSFIDQRISFKDIIKLWKQYLYGREIEENIAKFNFLSD